MSPDPFGLGTGPAGDVTADVSSPSFAIAGPLQLPSASSEVVMTTNALQATSDLRALAAPSALPCVQTAVRALFSLGQVQLTGFSVKSLSPPDLTPAQPRAGFSILISGPSFGKIRDDAYFYTVGRAELVLSFTGLNGHFPANWALSISKKIVARAEALVPD